MIDANIVRAIFSDCLFKEGEDTSNHIPAEGVVRSVSFHPQRLESHREEVRELIKQLPIEFMPEHMGGGDGYTFLNLPFDKDGNQWGEQINAEQLFQLANGLNMASFLMPRQFWPMMPGGVPYISFDPS